MKRTRLALLLVFGMLAALLPMAAVPAGAADGHLLLTEIVVTPTGGEFVEIYNPTASAIDLSDYYLTDATFAGGGTYYYNIVTSSNAGGGGFADFHARFPAGATIGAGEYQTVAIAGSSDFQTTYGAMPDYELFEDGFTSDAIPDMLEALPGSINNQGGLTNDGEVVVLYSWNGGSDLVTDVDYAVWGDKVEAVDKTGVAIDGPDADADSTAYKDDTAIASQDVIANGAHSSGSSFQRVDLTEGTEVGTGGNGPDGDDETSENLGTTWLSAAPSPGAAYEPPPPPEEACGDPFTPIYEIQGSGSASPLSGLVALFISYEGGFEADGGPADGSVSTDIGVSEGSSTPSGSSLQLIGSGSAYDDFSWGGPAAATPGTVNSGQTLAGPAAADVLPWINEFHYDNSGGDVGEFIEVAGPAGFDLAGWSLVLYNGNGGAPYTTTPLGGIITDAGSGFGFVSVQYPVNGIQNGSPDGIALVDAASIVSTQGVVVGDFQEGLGGFFIQDAAGDADPETSDGLFIAEAGIPAFDLAGRTVRVSGTVDESNGLTQLAAVTLLLDCGSGDVGPTSIGLPVGRVDDFEPFEGMYVTFPQPLVISEYFNFDRFGEIVLTSERSPTPTAEFEPGPDAIQAAQEFLLDKITLDDGRTSQNPDPAIHPNGSVFDLNNLFRGGDTVANVTGVMDYGFGLYRIQPTQGADYTNTNPRTASPDPVGGSLKVATFNVLNYFTTLDDGVNDICGPAGDQECRGADDATEFARQRAKIIAALVAIDADVVGLTEIENHPGDVPIADLVSGLNDVMGAGTYDYVATGAIGTDAIRVAAIYKPASVMPVGDYAVLDSSVDIRFNDDKNRPVLAQTFVEKATGGVFTAAVNHLKSKGSSCDDVGDPDLGDGAGNCNLTREAAAEALVDWLAGDPTGSGDPDYLIIGDLNSYDKEDPIDVLIGAGYSDLIDDYLGEYAYSYVFDGQIGYLDYQLANPTLAEQVTGATVWHINADEPDLIDYDTSFKKDAQDAIYAPDAYRSSDHDPVIVGLALTPAKTLKETAGLELSLLLFTGNKNDDKFVQNAIDRIDQSLNPGWWVDASTLDPKDGGKVFDREHQAVQELMKVKTVDVQASIGSILTADRQLALKELLAAIDAGGNAGRIQNAMDRLDDAAASIAGSDYAKAVLDYKKAWQEAIKAG